MYNCYLTCPRGLEEIAGIDIQLYGHSIEPDKGGIKFQTDQEGIYKINLNSRIGMHLLVELFHFNATDQDQLYEGIYNFQWDQYIDIHQTFSIKVRGNSQKFENKNYTTLKIKDAIADQIKKVKLARPSIDKENPDIIISVFIKEEKLTIYLDSSGVSLHKRGYRNKIHRAALNESLAAGLIMLSGWNKTDPFYDTMCGSGTLPIEAALMAHNIAPGLLRKHFAFQEWHDYDESLFSKIKKEVQDAIAIKSDIKIYGFDLIFSNIAMALYSAKLLELDKYLVFKKQDMSQFMPSSTKGTVIINPPYGERLDKDDSSIDILYKMIGDTFKTQCIGFDCYVFTGNLEKAKFIGLKTSKKVVLKNGSLDCRFLHYPIQSGKYNKKGSL